jgi:hypothetical protein
LPGKGRQKAGEEKKEQEEEEEKEGRKHQLILFIRK